MKDVNLRIDILIRAGLAIFVLLSSMLAQANDKNYRNNPYAPSPRVDQTARSDDKRSTKVSINSGLDEFRIVSEGSGSTVANADQRSSETFNRPTDAAVDPTRVYRVGIGDVLDIKIENSATSSGYFTVRNDGTIDFPLAGDNVVVVGRTIDQIEATITESIKLFKVPQVRIAIREYVSHAVQVKGMVNLPGFHQLHRDAVPLYVIRAAVDVSPGASGVKIDRIRDRKIESYLLANSIGDGVLIFSGDTVEFTGPGESANIGYYSIAGDVANSGKREFSEGMTLSKAIASDGGLRGNPKRVIVRRRNDRGMINTTEFQIKALFSGKISDLPLMIGDMIEVVK